MARVKVKTTIKPDDNLLKSFECLLGDNPTSYDPFVCMDKINKMKKEISNICRYHDLIITYNNIKTIYLDHTIGLKELEQFNLKLKLAVDVVKPKEIVDYSMAMYIFKENEIFTSLTFGLRGLLKFKKYLQAPKTDANQPELKFEPDPSFVTNQPGTVFYLLEYVKINFKDIFININCTKKDKKYLLDVIVKIKQSLEIIYNAITTPNINTEAFGEQLISGLYAMKDKVPGANKGFDAIKNSIDLIKNNFNKYYSNIVHTGSGTNIIEDFLNDVKSAHSTDLTTVAELSKIMGFISTAVQKTSSSGKQNVMLKQFRQVQQSYNKYIGIIKSGIPDGAEDIQKTNVIEGFDDENETKTNYDDTTSDALASAVSEFDFLKNPEIKQDDQEEQEQNIENLDEQISILKDLLEKNNIELEHNVKEDPSD